MSRIGNKVIVLPAGVEITNNGNVVTVKAVSYTHLDVYKRQQLIFPEINFDDVDKTRGLDIVIVTTANTDEESRELLTGLGMPFAK